MQSKSPPAHACHLVLIIAISLGSVGCLERESATAGPRVSYQENIRVEGSGAANVDILFVIDNSGSMSAEQAKLAEQIPRLVESLASPPDQNADGHPDWNAAESIRVAITTTDTGAGSATNTRGDYLCDPNASAPGTRGDLVFDRVFEWHTGQTTDALVNDVRSAVDAIGTDGCGYEQPLEAAAQTLERTRRAGRFPRTDSVLAVVFVTDEDDCSVASDDTYFTNITAINAHCLLHETELTHVEDLYAVIRGDQSEFVVASIVGVPLNHTASPAATLASGVLEVQLVGEGGRRRPAPICESAPSAADTDSERSASPAPRVAQFTALNEAGLLTSICEPTYENAIAQLAARVGQRVDSVCLGRPIPDYQDVGQCTVFITLPNGYTCEEFPGYTSIAPVDDGRARCTVAHANNTPYGFVYDDSDDMCPHLRFTDASVAPVGATVEAQCFFEVLLEDNALCAFHDQCISHHCDVFTQRCTTTATGAVSP